MVLLLEAALLLVVLGLSMAHVQPFATGTLLFVLPLGWLSMRLRRVTWRQAGLFRPANWKRLIVIGIVGGVAQQGFMMVAVDPVLELAGVPAPKVEGLTNLASGGIAGFALTLLVAWIVGGVFEEMAFRGYLMTRLRDGFTGRAGMALSLVLSATYFGLSHWYQGPSGVIEAGVAGLIEGSTYLATGGNLLLPIVLHGAFDTAGIALLAAGFTGW